MRQHETALNAANPASTITRIDPALDRDVRGMWFVREFVSLDVNSEVRTRSPGLPVRKLLRTIQDVFHLESSAKVPNIAEFGDELTGRCKTNAD